MKACIKALSFYVCLSFASLIGYEPSYSKIKALYSRLHPRSVAQHLAFYELYPHTHEGKCALTKGLGLICQDNSFNPCALLPLNSIISAVVGLVNKQANEPPCLTEEELFFIEKIAHKLPNRQLKGYGAKSEAEVLQLLDQDIDLARGLFLSQLGTSDSALHTIRCYEAAIDLLALQIQARLSKGASAEEKICAINHFIFTELGYRFPPQSIYSKEIDVYTFLPSVLDSRRGVCLGISLLYLSLAQRLNLPLQIITPPGHIYLRYKDEFNEINIETTARGIHLDSDEYLSIDHFALQERTIKQAIGLAHFNQASIHLQNQDFTKALKAYEQAEKYLPQDALLMELLATCCLLTQQEARGRALLQATLNAPSPYEIKTYSFAKDYLQGHADLESIKALFIPVDEKRSSIIKKQAALKACVARQPYFREALFALITTWIQLHRFSEALALLEKFHELDDQDPKVEYYLAALHAERFNYPKAWIHLKQAESILKPYNYNPKALKDLRHELSHLSPEVLE